MRNNELWYDGTLDGLQRSNTYLLNYEKLEREALNLFEWTGDPLIPFDILERDLIKYGGVVAFEHDVYGFMIARCTAREIDRYGRPTVAEVNINTTIDAIHEVLNLVYDDSPIPGKHLGVYMKNNLKGQSLKIMIDKYAELMTMLDLTTKVNILWQNLPPIFTVDDEKKLLSYKKMISDIFKGEPFLLVDNLMLRDTKGKSTYEFLEVPFKFNELQKAREQLLNNYRAELGILSAGTTKESGVAQNELTLNAQALNLNVSDMLTQRQKASELIQKHFNKTMVVRVRAQKKEGEENGASDDRIKEPTED